MLAFNTAFNGINAIGMVHQTIVTWYVPKRRITCTVSFAEDLLPIESIGPQSCSRRMSPTIQTNYSNQCIWLFLLNWLFIQLGTRMI